MFEAYKVAVKLSLVNGVSAGLLQISQLMQKTHGQATGLQKELHKIKLLMASGAALTGAGAFGLGLIGKTIEPAKEYAHQLAQMNVAGMKQLEIVNATAAAWNAAKGVPTSSAAENLAAVRELRMVFGDTEHAIANMPTVQRLQAILKTVKGGSAKDEAYEVAKALELKGAVKSPEQFTAQADMMAKAIVASGGKVGATDFLGTFKYGRAATSGWNDNFAYTILPTLIQEMKTAGGSGGGAGGPGNALMSAYAAVVGGAIPQKALQVWNKLGMLDQSKVVWTKDGHAKGVGPGGIKGSELFQANPYEWATTFLVPALAKAGYTTEAQQKQALQYLFPNRTAGFVMSQFVTQGWKFERDKKLIEGASGLSSYDSLMKNDPEMAALALHKQWQSLLSILGYQIMPELIKGTLWLIEKFRFLSQWFSDNQGKTRALMYSFIGLSVALAFSGTILMLTGAFKGLGLVIGAAGAIGGLPSALSATATGMRLVASAAGVFMAAYAGWVAGGFLNDKINQGVKSVTGGKNDSLGGWIYDALHQKGSWKGTTQSSDPDAPRYVAPGRAGGKSMINNTIVMPDGKVLAKVVTQEQSRTASRPSTGISGFDGTMTPVPIGTP